MQPKIYKVVSWNQLLTFHWGAGWSIDVGLLGHNCHKINLISTGEALLLVIVVAKVGTHPKVSLHPSYTAMNGQSVVIYTYCHMRSKCFEWLLQWHCCTHLLSTSWWKIRFTQKECYFEAQLSYRRMHGININDIMLLKNLPMGIKL